MPRSVAEGASVKLVWSPAVALFWNEMFCPSEMANVWVVPDELVMPAPSISRMSPVTLNVNALAPGLKTSSATGWKAETSSTTVVTPDAPKVATSEAPLGTVAGVQLLALFHSLFTGDAFQVALPATAAGKGAETKNNAARTAQAAG